MLLALGAATASVVSPIGVAQVSAAPSPILMAHPPKPINDFELLDTEGRPFRFSQLRNRLALVFFGFTRCPDVCPTTLVKLRALADSMAQQAPAVEVVMISVDGDRDSPAVMKAYLERVSPRFIGLTGNPNVVRGIAAQFPAVFFKELADRSGDPYTITHTSQVYLIDRDGRLRATFFDAPIKAMQRVTRSLAE